MSDITTCDLLVIGSGGAGLTAAITAKTLGLDVLIVEKEPVYGGTTARSGGWLWIPANPKAEAVGIKDSKEQARLYLQAETGNRFDAARVDAFLDNGPDMIRFLEAKTGLCALIWAKPFPIITLTSRWHGRGPLHLRQRL